MQRCRRTWAVTNTWVVLQFESKEHAWLINERFLPPPPLLLPAQPVRLLRALRLLRLPLLLRLLRLLPLRLLC